MDFDKNTKYSWIDEEEVKTEEAMRNEIYGIIGLSFAIAIVLVISFFLLVL
ncbi:hypothetical protein [Fulvivirga sp. M361]|uniref:hypothetical protein n=1 Tax=Fulvivirga sp. M361 TaxID=2594266 RepID=UPI001626432F|nr:hypothetical protein [Fulvivirga sp. M361]